MLGWDDGVRARRRASLLRCSTHAAGPRSDFPFCVGLPFWMATPRPPIDGERRRGLRRRVSSCVCLMVVVPGSTTTANLAICVYVYAYKSALE
jgi:hypothetical protein